MWVRVALLAAAILVVSCSGSSRKTNVAAPAPAQGAWVASLFGTPADVSLFIRPSAVRVDPYWGPLASRLLSGPDREGDFISHGSATLLSSARQLDMHFTIRDPLGLSRGRDGPDGHSSKGDWRSIGWVAVFHGLPPTDPLALRTGAGRPLYAQPVRLPSGVLHYSPDRAYLEDHGSITPTLFVTPDGTCILIDQTAAPRARDVLSTTAASPPILQAPPSALAGVSFGITTMRFINAERSDRAALTQGAVAIGMGVRGGSQGAIEGFADYATEEDAERGYKAFQRSCAEKADACALEPGMFREARAEREDRRIIVSLVFSEALLRSLQNWTP